MPHGSVKGSPEGRALHYFWRHRHVVRARIDKAIAAARFSDVVFKFLAEFLSLSSAIDRIATSHGDHPRMRELAREFVAGLDGQANRDFFARCLTCRPEGYRLFGAILANSALPLQELGTCGFRRLAILRAGLYEDSAMRFLDGARVASAAEPRLAAPILQRALRLARESPVIRDIPAGLYSISTGYLYTHLIFYLTAFGRYSLTKYSASAARNGLVFAELSVQERKPDLLAEVIAALLCLRVGSKEIEPYVDILVSMQNGRGAFGSRYARARPGTWASFRRDYHPTLVALFALILWRHGPRGTRRTRFHPAATVETASAALRIARVLKDFRRTSGLPGGVRRFLAASEVYLRIGSARSVQTRRAPTRQLANGKTSLTRADILADCVLSQLSDKAPHELTRELLRIARQHPDQLDAFGLIQTSLLSSMRFPGTRLRRAALDRAMRSRLGEQTHVKTVSRPRPSQPDGVRALGRSLLHLNQGDVTGFVVNQAILWFQTGLCCGLDHFADGLERLLFHESTGQPRGRSYSGRTNADETLILLVTLVLAIRRTGSDADGRGRSTARS